MNSREIEKLFAEALAGTLDAEESKALERHLERHPERRRELTELEGLWEALGRLEEPAEKPGPEARARFDGMLAAFREGLERGAVRRERLARFGRWLWPGWRALQPGPVFAALLAGLVLGGALGWPGVGENEISRLEGEVARLSATVAMTLLEPGRSASDRLRAVGLVARGRELEPRVLQTLIETLEEDSNDNVRLAAVDALARHAGRDEVREALSRSLARQSSPMVQLTLAEILLRGEDPRAERAVRELLTKNEIDPTVRSHLAAKLGPRV